MRIELILTGGQQSDLNDALIDAILSETDGIATISHLKEGFSEIWVGDDAGIQVEVPLDRLSTMKPETAALLVRELLKVLRDRTVS